MSCACQAIVRNTKKLGCGRVIERYCQIAAALRTLLERFLTVLDCVDAAFVADETLDQLPLAPRSATPASVGST